MDHLSEATCAIAESGHKSWSVVRVVAVILSEPPHAVTIVLSEPMSTVRIHTYSRPDHVRGFTRNRPSLVRAHLPLFESAHIAAVILSEDSHSIALVWTESTVGCHSLRILSPWPRQRLPILSPWSCQSLLSVVSVLMYSCHDLVKDFSGYRPGLLGAHRLQSESALILGVIVVPTQGWLSESRHVFHRLPF